MKRRDSESSFQSFKTGIKHEFASFEEHGQMDESTDLKKIDKSIIHKNNLMMSDFNKQNLMMSNSGLKGHDGELSF